MLTDASKAIYIQTIASATGAIEGAFHICTASDTTRQTIAGAGACPEGTLIDV